MHTHEAMDNLHSQSGPSNSRSPYHSPHSGQGEVGKAPPNNFGCSSMSGMSSRTSPLGANKTVAFSRLPGEGPAASSLTRTGPGCGHNAGPVGQHQSTLRAGPRLRAEGLMVPPASDAATLRRQVAALQMDLDAHIDGEQRLQSINQQLRERLELYMKQNHENVERAESELNTLHEDMEQTLELQRRLAQRATGLEKEKKDIENLLQVRVLEFECERTALQNRIQNMGEDLRTKAEAQEKVNHLQVELSSTLEVKAQLEEQLSKIAEETFFLEKKADDYSRELQELLSKEQWDQKLDRMGRRAMTRRAFSNYQNGVREQCIDRANMVRAISKHKHTGCKKVFYLLRMATCRSCILRQLNVAQCQAAFCTSWEKWKLSMVSERNYRIYLEKQSKRAVTNAMQAWMAYILHVRLSPERYVMALNYWHQRCLQNCFRKWLQVLRFWKFPPKEEKVHMEKASRHHIKTSLCRYLVSWQGWLTTYARPKKLKFAVVQAHIDKMTMKQIVAAWRCMLHVKWVSRLKNDEATSFRKNWCLRRFSARWRQHTIEIKTFKLRNSQAMEYRAHRLKHLALQCWRNFMQHQMHMQIYKQMAFRQYLRSLAIMVAKLHLS